MSTPTGPAQPAPRRGEPVRPRSDDAGGAASPSSQITPVRVSTPQRMQPAGDAHHATGNPAGVAAVSSANSPIWWDERRPSPEWNSPTRLDAVSRTTKTLTVLALVLLLAAGVWLAGGLKAGGVRFRFVPTGQVITSGPFELTFIKGFWTWNEHRNDGKGGWVAALHGTCRNIDTTSRRNLELDLSAGVVLGAYQGSDVKVATDKRVSLGEWGRGMGFRRDELAPGLPAIPCSFEGDMPMGFKPTARMVVGVYDLYWNDSNDVQTGGKRWLRRDSGVRMQVPAVVLAEE